MTTQFQYNFNYLNDRLLSMGSVNSASMLQAYISGALSGGMGIDDGRLHLGLTRFAGLEPGYLDTESSELLSLFIQKTGQSLSDDNFIFTPLLPEDDEASLQRRAQEISFWSEGFLHGYAVSQKDRADGDLNSTVSDTLRDMAQIALVDTEDLADEAEQTEDAERQLFDIAEYLKVTTLTIYQETHAKKDTH